MNLHRRDLRGKQRECGEERQKVGAALPGIDHAQLTPTILAATEFQQNSLSSWKEKLHGISLYGGRENTEKRGRRGEDERAWAALPRIDRAQLGPIMTTATESQQNSLASWKGKK